MEGSIVTAGRPRVMDDAKRALVVGYIAGGGSLTGAAGHAGVGRNTVYAEMERNQDFRAEIEKARSKSEDFLVQRVRTHSKEDWRAASWLLERLHGQDYGNLQKHEVTGAGGGPLIVFKAHDVATWGKDTDDADGPTD